MPTDTILVDGVDIIASTRWEEDRDGYYAIPPARGDLITYPGVDGETNTDQPFGPTVFTQHLMLEGASYTAANDEWKTLVRLCKPGGTVLLTKRMSFVSGGDQDYTAVAKLRDIQRSRVNPVLSRCVVEWSLLDGVWYAPAVTTSLSSGLNSPSISGAVRTKRMTITLTGGTTPTLVNSTTGHQLHFNGTMSASVIIDVENGTATRSGVDVSEALTWTKLSPFALLPAGNDLVLSGGGTASISYSPAYP